MEPLNQKITNLLARTASNLRKAAGNTLIEVLVSSILMTFSVTSSVAVLGTGSRLGEGDNYRRQARAIMRTAFEQEYSYKDYNTIPNSSSTVESVEIDPRQGTSLIGELRKNIVSENISTIDGLSIAVKRVTVTCKWNDAKGVADSVSLVKLVAKAE